LTFSGHNFPFCSCLIALVPTYEINFANLINQRSSLREWFFHEDRAEQIMRWRQVGPRGNDRRSSLSFFDQPSVHHEVLFEIGQTPFGEKLIRARTEKQIVRNINRRGW